MLELENQGFSGNPSKSMLHFLYTCFQKIWNPIRFLKLLELGLLEKFSILLTKLRLVKKLWNQSFV